MASAIPSAPPGGKDSPFKRFRVGRRELYLHRDLLAVAPELVMRLDALDRAVEPGAGNRASGFRVELKEAPGLFVRLARRGGLMRLVARDLYLGIEPRPFRELRVAIEARRRGIPVAEPMGAGVKWVFPGCYRGAFITRAASGMTLWDFVRTDDDPIVRAHVLEQARRAIDTMHQQGLAHADLNLGNIFVTPSGESFAVIVLDLDKARLLRLPVPAQVRAATAARLARSARKLDPARRYFDDRALSLLGIGAP